MADEAFPGRSVIFEWDGAEIKGVREKSIALNGDAIDISSDDSAGWRELLEASGEDKVDISISGVVKTDRLKADWFAGNRIKPCTITYPNGSVISGNFRLDSHSEKGGYKDAETFEAKLSSTGAVSFTPYS